MATGTPKRSMARSVKRSKWASVGVSRIARPYRASSRASSSAGRGAASHRQAWRSTTARSFVRTCATLAGHTIQSVTPSGRRASTLKPRDTARMPTRSRAPDGSVDWTASRRSRGWSTSATITIAPWSGENTTASPADRTGRCSSSAASDTAARSAASGVSTRIDASRSPSVGRAVAARRRREPGRVAGAPTSRTAPSAAPITDVRPTARSLAPRTIASTVSSS